MRQFAIQMFSLLGALFQIGTPAETEEIGTIMLFCGAGLDTALWCLAAGWG
jgi:hypothetical protein